MVSSNCTSVREGKLLVAVFSVFPVIAMASYTLSIAMIVRISAYRKFSHRLVLYLAIAGVIRTCALWLQVLPVDIEQPDGNPVSVREGWNSVCVFSGFFGQYTAFGVALIVVWISLYIFVLVLFQKQLGNSKREIFGILVIVFAPLIFTWEPFIGKAYGLRGVTCWIAENCQNESSQSEDSNLLFIVALSLAPHIVLRLVSLAMILVAVIALCRNARRGLLKHKHWLAIREILPLIMYPSLYAVMAIGRIVADLAGKNVTVEYDYVISDVIETCTFQVFTLTVPLSLLLQPSFRHELCNSINRRSRLRGEPLDPSQAYARHVQEEAGPETDCTSEYATEANHEVTRSILGITKAYQGYTSLR